MRWRGEFGVFDYALFVAKCFGIIAAGIAGILFAAYIGTQLQAAGW